MKLSFVVVFLSAALLCALGAYGYFSFVRPARALVREAKPEAGKRALAFAECLAHGPLPSCSDPLTTEGFRAQHPPELLDTMVGAIHARFGEYRTARVDEQSFTATENRGPNGKRLEVSLRLIASFDNEPALPVSITLEGKTIAELKVASVSVTP